jgi:hypothetical protein
MTISYNQHIPAATDIISDSQSQLQVNTDAVFTIWQRDHYTFSESAAGQSPGKHRQVTFSSKVAQGAQIDPQSALFTASGSASAVADLRFINQNATFPINALRACVNFTGDTFTPIINSQFNVVSVTVSGSNYLVTLSPNATSGNIVIVSILSQSGRGYSWSFSSNSLTILQAINDHSQFSVLIYQI